MDPGQWRLAAHVGCVGLLIAVWPLVVPASSGEPKYKGKTLEQWVEGLGDLSAEYREEAAEALAHFGTRAIPHLRRSLAAADSETAVLAATSLLRMSEPGRVALKMALTGTQGEQVAVMEALYRSEEDNRWAVPVLQNLANDPKLLLSAQRVIGALTAYQSDEPAVKGVAAGADYTTWNGEGVSVRFRPPDCFVEGQFPWMRVGIKLGTGTAIDRGRAYFNSMLDMTVTKQGIVESTGWYFVDLSATDESDGGGYRSYRAKLPKPFLRAVSVDYFVEVATTDGKAVRTNDVSGPIMKTAEDCVILGRLPAEAGPKGAVTVHSAAPARRR